MFKKYYRLTKPGIIYGNILTAAAGFFLASKNHVDFWLLAFLLIGTSLVIGSACAINNYLDRDIDAAMSRTKKRALVTGTIESRQVIVFATIIGVIGFSTLAASTNTTTVVVGAIGFIDYVLFYSLAKRSGSYGTIVGSIAGSTPPVAGYTAVTHHIDSGAVLLFVVLTLWQMPHFYSIAIYRLKDYRAAKLPVLPLILGIRSTKKRILWYILGFGVAASLLTILGYTGYIFLIVVIILVAWWLWIGIRGFNARGDGRWARKMFLFSLVVITLSSLLIALGRHSNPWF